ncbi:MAG: hypothetical protein GOVbin40013_11 [Prokaryotic dsDNA virus sp.]|jgi:hypothetical protein|nr:MAG: hypothetical protein GOVbin40013_11 [Prokaryotic dsDNA virus sp.]
MTQREQIDKIVGYKTWSVKRKVDSLLEIDCNLYTNLGIDSSASERKKVKALSKVIYKAISNISPIDGYLIKAWYEEKPQ